MEKLKILCPNCKDRLLTDNQCQQCDYNTTYDQFLITNLLSSYNLSLSLIAQNRIVDAWEEIRKHLHQYPFILEYLNLAFVLSIINGDYIISGMILKRLNAVIPDQDYKEYLTLLNTNIKVYNEIVDGKYELQKIEKSELSLQHLFILFLQSKDNDKPNSLRKIKKIDPRFASTLTHSYILPKLSTTYKIILTTLIGIAGITYNYYEYNERQELRVDNHVLTNTNTQVQEQKDTLDVLLKKSYDDIHALQIELKTIKVFNEINVSKIKNLEMTIQIKRREIDILSSDHKKDEKWYRDLVDDLSSQNKDLNKNHQLSLLDNAKIVEEQKANTKIIEEQNKLLLVFKVKLDSIQNRDELLTEKFDKLEDFTTLINNREFITLANYLSEKEYVDIIIHDLGVIGEGHIESICETLYSMEDFQKVLDINYSCSKESHSYYQLYLKKKKNPERMDKLEEFILRFNPSKTESYVASFLADEIIPYYLGDGDDLSKACEYYKALTKHIISFPEHEKYKSHIKMDNLKGCK